VTNNIHPSKNKKDFKMPTKHKVYTADQFLNIIPDLKFGKLENFPNSENGRKVNILSPEDLVVDFQGGLIDDPLDCPFGVTSFTDEQTGKVRWTCTFTPKVGSSQAAALSALEERVVKLGQNNPDWFTKAGWPKKLVNDNGISMNFNSILKESTNAEYPDPQWKTTVTPTNISVVVRNEETGACISHESNGYKVIEKKRCKTIPIASLAYIWFAGGKWGIKFYLNQIIVTHIDKGNDKTSLSNIIGMEGIQVQVVKDAPETKAPEPAANVVGNDMDVEVTEPPTTRRKIQPVEDLNKILLGE